MPTYEYRCKDCGEHLEVVQAFTDDPLTECPACSGPGAASPSGRLQSTENNDSRRDAETQRKDGLKTRVEPNLWF